jgi:hypothetical protein
MKNFKKIIGEISSIDPQDQENFQELLLKYICYSPKMPLRIFQEQLIDSAEKTVLTVKNHFFSEQELSFNVFKWGSGSRRIILTHGWASKGADFYDLILALQKVEDVELIAFDAPGNGSSEGDLSGLMLFVEAVKAIVEHFGQPEVTIGHSLGAMANIVALAEIKAYPKQIISMAPMVNLGANFKVSMEAIAVTEEAQQTFFGLFEERFQQPISHFNLIDWASFTTEASEHWVAYDENDKIAPFLYTESFLAENSSITATNYVDAGHEKIIRLPNVIEEVLTRLR